MQNNPQDLPLIQLKMPQQENPTTLKGGVEYTDYRPAISDFNNRLSDEVKKTLTRGALSTNPVGQYLYMNPASRAFIYNAIGVNEMNNSDFFPNEIDRAREATMNSLSRQGGRFDRPIDVTTLDYGMSSNTNGSNYIKNYFSDPMRMTMGSMWVAPNGKVLNPLNGEFYYGDIYDFHPSVQGNPEYRPEYQVLQAFSTKIRELQGKDPMVINLDLGEPNKW